MHYKCICIILYLLPQVTLHNETKQIHPDQIEFRSHSSVNKIVLFFAQKRLANGVKKRKVTDSRQTADTSYSFSIPCHGRTE